ncbi:MAG TPA: protease complex subunit PrcB family protein [Vicinamibacterales bacterium]|nr:protease complex subunit PrcB family protein [Vicinamibacterales bacterium]
MSVLTTIARGETSRISEARRAVARTESEWQTLWAVHAGPGSEPPAVDLGTMTIAAAFAGEKPSAGHSIEITAGVGGGPVMLFVEEHGPGPGTAAATILTSPFHIVAVAKSAGDVVWEDGEVSRNRTPFQPSSPATGAPSSTGLEPRTAAALSYLAGPFSGVLILMAETTNQDVRFHAWQSIVGLGGLGLAVLASYVLAFVALFVSATVVSVMVGVSYVIWFVLIAVWVICLWQAWSGGRWKLPLVGDYAERFN